MARDIAGRFNHVYQGEYFTLPEAVVGEQSAVLSGLDGRKMSKSYGNVIPLFCPEKAFRKHIMKIVTNSLEPGEPKDADSCTLFQISPPLPKIGPSLRPSVNSMNKVLAGGAETGVI